MIDVKYIEPYADGVIENKDGVKRIGRLNKNKTHFDLASYQQRKTMVVWGVKDVVSYKKIDF